jgi:hypothetical protein
MPPIRKNAVLKRNDRCQCGSGRKYKHCCSADAPAHVHDFSRAVHYIDSGEAAVRWVISDTSGTKFFSDKDGRVLVFADKSVATGVALMDEFNGQEPGEINVAAVGPTKWQILQEKLPFFEVPNLDVGVALVRERIAHRTAELATQTDDPQEGTEPDGQEEAGEEASQAENKE